MVMSTVDWDTFMMKQNKQIVECCVGDLVRLKDGREGRVLFKGPTEFSQGVWLGVELSKGEGLNDGMVKGVRYFQAQGSKHGAFVREQKIKEKLDMQIYKSLPLNRRISSLNLEASRASISSKATLLENTRGSVGSTSMLLEDIEREEEKSAKEEEWCLSTSSEG